MDDVLGFQRIRQKAIVLTVAGSVLWSILGGWRHGAGFAAGGVISCIVLFATHWYVQRISPEMSKKPGMLASMIRYLVLAAALYVILKSLRLDLGAALAGLFVAAAAATLEILFELFRSWNTK